MGNPVVHWEMLSKDPAKVSAFYEKVFGWKIHQCRDRVAFGPARSSSLSLPPRRAAAARSVRR